MSVRAMKVAIIILCVLGLLLTQTFAKGKPTYEELLLQNRRLEEKVDAALSVMKSMKVGFDAKIKSLNTTLASAKAKWTENRQAAAFLAVKTSGGYVSNYRNVLFNSVRYSFPTNMNGYNSATGTYRCPYDGTYVFFVSIVGYYTHSSYRWYKFEIRKEGSRLATAYAYLTSSNYYETMSAMAVTKCSKGQKVYIYNYSGYQQYVYDRSHFAGYKIA